jgi:hypothetical protein
MAAGHRSRTAIFNETNVIAIADSPRLAEASTLLSMGWQRRFRNGGGLSELPGFRRCGGLIGQPVAPARAARDEVGLIVPLLTRNASSRS